MEMTRSGLNFYANSTPVIHYSNSITLLLALLLGFEKSREKS